MTYVAITIGLLVILPKAMVGMVNSLSTTMYDRVAAVDRLVDEAVDGEPK